MNWDVLAASLGSLGVGAGLLRAVEYLFGRRKLEAESRRIEADTEGDLIKSLKLLQDMYSEMLGRWQIAVSHTTKCDQELAAAKVTMAKQDFRIQALEGRLAAAKEAL